MKANQFKLLFLLLITFLLSCQSRMWIAEELDIRYQPPTNVSKTLVTAATTCTSALENVVEIPQIHALGSTHFIVDKPRFFVCQAAGLSIAQRFAYLPKYLLFCCLKYCH